MCLMQTDLPVPDGPRIIEILPSGRPMFRPRSTRLRPNALWTSTNSMASGAPVGRLRPVCHLYSSSSSSGSRLVGDGGADAGGLLVLLGLALVLEPARALLADLRRLVVFLVRARG